MRPPGQAGQAGETGTAKPVWGRPHPHGALDPAGHPGIAAGCPVSSSTTEREGRTVHGFRRFHPTQWDRHIQVIAEQGRVGWQRTSGYNARAGAEGAMSRYKRIIGDTLRSHTRPAQETRIAVSILNRMLDLGRPESVRAA